jgi:hypothetical protein
MPQWSFLPMSMVALLCIVSVSRGQICVLDLPDNCPSAKITDELCVTCHRLLAPSHSLSLRFGAVVGASAQGGELDSTGFSEAKVACRG